ncbi:MAG: outer membrane beta-barrel protein [Burkholderiales bacterium]
MIALLAASGLSGAPDALARGPFYVGASAGRSDIDDEIAFPGLITSGTADGKNTGYKIFGGYEFNPYFGVEVSLVDLGKVKYSGSYLGAPVTGGKVEVVGLNASAVGIVPVNESFSLFGKLGIFAWEASWSDVTGGVPTKAQDNGADLSIGAGFTFNFTKNFSARLEWERFKAGGGEDYNTGFPNLTSSAKIDFVSLGFLFKF